MQLPAQRCMLPVSEAGPVQDVVFGYGWESQVAGIVVGLAILLAMRVVRTHRSLPICKGQLSRQLSVGCWCRSAPAGLRHLPGPVTRGQQRMSCEGGGGEGMYITGQEQQRDVILRRPIRDAVQRASICAR